MKVVETPFVMLRYKLQFLMVNFIFTHFKYIFKYSPSYLFWQEGKGKLFGNRALDYEQWRKAMRHSKIYRSIPNDADLASVACSIMPPKACNPVITVVVVVCDQIYSTLNCIKSVAEIMSNVPFEIIVVADGSGAKTVEFLSMVKGIRVFRMNSSVGFSKCCNVGATNARGDYLLFLGNEFMVQPGCLEELFRVFDEYPEAGIVFSKCQTGKNKIYNSGATSLMNGSYSLIGEGEEASLPLFCFLRETDFCSIDCFMTSASLYFLVGGFNEIYKSKIYACIDFSLAVKSKKKRIYFQPFSKVIKLKSNHINIRLQKTMMSEANVDQQLLFDRWMSHTDVCGDQGTSLLEGQMRNRPRRALVIDETTPTPDKDSGSIDTLYYLKMLKKLNYTTTFIPDDLRNAGHYTEALQRMGVKCLYGPSVRSIRQYLKNNGSRYDLVILNRVMPALRNIEHVRRFCPNAKVVYNTVDLHFLREERRARQENSKIRERDAERVKLLELKIMTMTDATIVISEVEYGIVKAQWPHIKFVHIPFVREVHGCKNEFTTRKDVVFIGGFRHSPNIDAVLYFVNEVMPEISRAIPDLNFIIVGSHVPPEILKCGERVNVKVIGFVEQLDDVFNNCRLTVAPLRYGAGIKGKIATSLAYGVPCIATSIAAEGMGLTPGTDVLVADSPESFANAVILAYQDELTWNNVSKCGLVYMQKQFSFDQGLQRLNILLDTIGLPHDDLEINLKT